MEFESIPWLPGHGVGTMVVVITLDSTVKSPYPLPCGERRLDWAPRLAQEGQLEPLRRILSRLSLGELEVVLAAFPTQCWAAGARLVEADLQRRLPLTLPP